MNPRPLMIRSRLYMLIASLSLTRRYPTGREDDWRVPAVFDACSGTILALILVKLQLIQPFRPELVNRTRGLGRESVVVVVRN